MGRASYFGVRPPAEAEIAAPEFPPRMEWLNVALLRMDRLVGRDCVLIEFFDTARINSHRTLGYVRAWHSRYRESGLRVIGVHSPGYSFGRDRTVVERAVSALGIEHPVLLDPALEVWRLYGNRGWPARYLFDRGGLLRHMHYGEGNYGETERAIQEVLRELDPGLQCPELLEPLRPEDAEGVLLRPHTAEVSLPAERARLELVRDWTEGEDYIEVADAGGAATVEFTAGGAWAVLSGAVEPGLYESDGTVVAEHPGLRLHGFQFTPLPPADG
ncbi:MAG: DipZ protein [Thermoleophilaceae bacterium]|nr:DipZ protein [Thermoleophilaceae bacterium]